MVFKIDEDGEGEESTKKLTTNTKQLQKASENISEDMLTPFIQYPTALSGFM